jgi:2'-5' RNA ligase
MGHTVLAVPVAELDEVVRERTAFYDASFVSADPGFAHAHITLLGPWVTEPSAHDLARVARIASEAGPFEATLAELGEFPDGVIHLRPDPGGPFRSLTARLAAAFPECPPYGGRYGEVAPHLTLDRRSADVSRATVRGMVAHLLPVTISVDRIDLQWWANHDCRLLCSWPLGSWPVGSWPVGSWPPGRSGPWPDC